VSTLLTRADEAIELLLQLLTAALGTNSPFAALHNSGSYRGFICRAFAVARPVGFDPKRSWTSLMYA
jgi:hypothetical protein